MAQLVIPNCPATTQRSILGKKKAELKNDSIIHFLSTLIKELIEFKFIPLWDKLVLVYNK